MKESTKELPSVIVNNFSFEDDECPVISLQATPPLESLSPSP